MNNHFRASREFPHHISIGGLVFNEDKKILVHHFKDVTTADGLYLGELYLLMRETIEDNETIEGALSRGLMEEFGLTGELLGHIGSVKGKYPLQDFWVEKTTLYFLVKYIEHDNSKREKDSKESESDLEWHDAGFLIEKMKLQKKIEDSLDESEIVENFKSRF